MAAPSSPLELTRRVAVLGTLASVASACTPFSLDLDAGTEPTEPRRSDPPRTDPDVDLAATVLAAEQSMVDLVAATLAAHPRLKRVLAQAQAVHEAHVTLLDDAAPPDEPGDVTAPGLSTPSAPSPTDPEQSGARRVPRDPGRALRSLAAAEDALSLANKQSAFAAKSGSFARVLASMAAASAQQAAVLRSARNNGGAR